MEPLLPRLDATLSSDFALTSDLPALLRLCRLSPRSSDRYLLSNFLYSLWPGTCFDVEDLCPSGESAKPAGGRTISSETSLPQWWQWGASRAPMVKHWSAPSL